MAFPTTPLLRDFNQADVDPDPQFTINPSGTYVTGNVKVLSNELRPSLADAYVYYNVSSFGPNAEAYFTYPAIVGQFELWVRASPLNSGMNGYCLKFEAADTFQLYRVDSLVKVALGASISFTFSAGDSIGIQAIGSSINCWHKAGSGAWTQRASRTDATYNQAGYVVMYLDQVGHRIDNFGAGTATNEPADAANAMFARRRRRIS